MWGDDVVGERLRTWVPPLAITVLVAILATFAVTAIGYPVRKLNLNDSGVWVTNNAEASWGRLNKSAAALDGTLNPPSAQQLAKNLQLDVLQDQFQVVGRDIAGGTLTVMDTAAVGWNEDRTVAVDPSFQVEMRGGTIAVLDPTTGQLWAAQYDETPGSVDVTALASTNRPLAVVGAPKAGPNSGQGVGLAVGVDGTVHAASTNGQTVTVKAGPQGFAEPVMGALPVAMASVQVSAVGGRATYLDAAAGTLVDPAGKVHKFDADARARLQVAGPEAESVAVATSTSLLTFGEAEAGSELFRGANGDPARPFVLAGCTFGAWAGKPGNVARSCAGDPAKAQNLDQDKALVQPVFRSNHGLIVLNDTADGKVYDLDLERFVDNWKDLQTDIPPEDNPKPQQQQQQNSNDPAPKANPDQVGARAGRTTILHVLDNDTDAAGGILAITSVTQPGGGASVLVAPDGQSLLYTMPAQGANGKFTYTISNGAKSATGDVTVELKTDADKTEPYLRPGVKPRLYPVASFGTVSIPVAGDWRDKEGDPVTVIGATAGDKAVSVTPDGRIDFVAGRADTTSVVDVKYQVSDGRSDKPVDGVVKVKVLAADATAGEAPLTAADSVRGEPGKPIRVVPLANDIPGADPLNASARTVLAAKVATKAGLTVDTDLATGEVLVNAKKAGTYFLDYTAKTGSAAFAQGRMRIDVIAGSDSDRPSAMPDQVTVRGQVPAMVDVLANDSDPRGSVLTVLSATTADDDRDAPALQVAVLKGRWVRVMPTTDQLRPNPMVVTYTVTNGTSEPVTGSLVVTQIPETDSDKAIVHDDVATVRAGDSVLVGVLDNDSSTSGKPLQIDTNGDGLTVGQLKVIDPDARAGEEKGDLGHAYVSGDRVRYWAPAQVDAPKQVIIQYDASTADGTPDTGRVTMTINPAPTETTPNRPPEPQALEARAVAGETLTIPAISSGQDPDGDTVSVVGIASAPTMGRIIGFSPTSITYQAFPSGAAGTDTFRYRVSDRYGSVEDAVVRVAITPAGDTQPAVAVADAVVAHPGVKVWVSPLANDMIPSADRATIAPLEDVNDPAPAGVTLDGERGPVTAQAPGKEEQPVQFGYALRNSAGVGPSATITISSREGYQNPPRIYEHVAVPKGDQASVDVLQNAWDPDGDPAKLKVTKVSHPDARIVGGTVTVPVAELMQVVSYEVTDENGSTAASVIHVPGAGNGRPYLKAGSKITMDANGKFTFDVNDYVISPRKRDVRVTVAESLASAPAEHLGVLADSNTTMVLTSQNDYTGPASVTMEVADGDPTDADTRTAVITIPVQVGPVTPVLNCPATAQKLMQGGRAVRIDVGQLCHVWMPEPDDIPKLRYTAEWVTPMPGVDVRQIERGLELQAAGSTKPPLRGNLRIGVEGTPALKQEVPVIVQRAPKPTIVLRDMRDVKQGTTVRQNLSMTSPLVDARRQIVSIDQLTNQPAQVSFQGTNFQITPGATMSGTMRFRVTATDLADKTRIDRHVTGTLTVTVYGVPAAPTAPVPAQQLQSRAASLSFQPGADNGAPILEFQVQGGGKTQSCGRSTRCQVTGLENGKAVTFQARARNKAGWGEWSPMGPAVTPNALPGRVSNLKASNPADRSLTLSWSPAQNEGSPVTEYAIRWNGGSKTVSGSTTSTTVTGLDNNATTTFTVVAKNAAGVSKLSASTTGQSSGRPVVGAPSVNASDLGATAQVTVSWGEADPQGPRPISYVVTRTGGGASKTFKTQSTSIPDSVTYDGTIYTYSVTAMNATGGAAHTSTPTSVSWTAIGKPGAWGDVTLKPTGANGTLALTYTAPPTRGKTAKISVIGSLAKPLSDGSGTERTTGSTTFTGLTNGTKYTIRLQACNESGACSQSAAVSATPYGPLAQPKIGLSIGDGAMVTYAVTANGNGRPAVLTVQANNKTQTYNVPAGGFSTPEILVPARYGSTVTVTATISDPGRTSQTATVSKTLPQAPALGTVRVDMVVDPDNKQRVIYNVTADSGGLPADLTINAGGQSTTRQINGAYQTGNQGVVIGWSKSYTVSATLRDASGYNRAPKSDSKTITTPAEPPPPRDFTVSQGPRSGQGSCSYKGEPDAYGCPTIVVTTTGYTGTYRCTFHSGSPDVAPWASTTMTGSTTKYTSAYFGYNFALYVNCDGLVKAFNF